MVDERVPEQVLYRVGSAHHRLTVGPDGGPSHPTGVRRVGSSSNSIRTRRASNSSTTCWTNGSPRSWSARSARVEASAGCSTLGFHRVTLEADTARPGPAVRQGHLLDPRSPSRAAHTRRRVIVARGQRPGPEDSGDSTAVGSTHETCTPSRTPSFSGSRFQASHAVSSESGGGADRRRHRRGSRSGRRLGRGRPRCRPVAALSGRRRTRYRSFFFGAGAGGGGGGAPASSAREPRDQIGRAPSGLPGRATRHSASSTSSRPCGTAAQPGPRLGQDLKRGEDRVERPALDHRLEPGPLARASPPAGPPRRPRPAPSRRGGTRAGRRAGRPAGRPSPPTASTSRSAAAASWSARASIRSSTRSSLARAERLCTSSTVKRARRRRTGAAPGATAHRASSRRPAGRRLAGPRARPRPPRCGRSPASVSTICSGAIPAKSYRWHRDRTVIGILFGSVVAKKNLTCSGGSSSVFSRALKAPVESMWTSSM